MKTLLKQWGGTCTQDAPKSVDKKYSHNSITICPISFAQMWGPVLYIGEQTEHFYYNVLQIKLLLKIIKNIRFFVKRLSKWPIARYQTLSFGIHS
jgi:hypothetical protein